MSDVQSLSFLTGLAVILLCVSVHFVGKRIDILKQRIDRLAGNNGKTE